MNAPLSHLVEVRTERIDSCPNCGSSELRFWCDGRDRLHELTKQVFTYSKCRGCEVVFLSSRPVEAEAFRFYPEDYAPYQASDSGAPGRRHRQPGSPGFIGKHTG